MRVGPIITAVITVASLATLSACSDDGIPAASGRNDVQIDAGPADVVVQLGSFNLGNNIDGFVVGPTVVIYGDGRAFGTARLLEYADVFGQVDVDLLRDIVAAGRALPDEVGDRAKPCAEDQLNNVLMIDGRSWSTCEFVGIDDFGPVVEGLLNEWDELGTELWEPSAWFVRIVSGECVVADAPAPQSYWDAPVFPHLEAQYPLGPIDCFAPV